jgi:hypothetical protein
MKNLTTEREEYSLPKPLPVNEAETRAEVIDPALQAAGWGVVEGRLAAPEGHVPSFIPPQVAVEYGRREGRLQPIGTGLRCDPSRRTDRS